MRVEGKYVLGTEREIAEIVLFEILNLQKKDKRIFSVDFALADEAFFSAEGINLESIFLSSKKKSRLFGIKPIDTGFHSSLDELMIDSYGGGNGKFVSLRKEDNNFQRVMRLMSMIREVMERCILLPYSYYLIGEFQKDVIELLGYIKTDDAQWVRKINQYNYHVAEIRDYESFDMETYICQGQVDLTDYLNDDGTYDKDAVNIIHSYYGSVSEFTKCCSNDNDRCQLLAEMIFETRDLSDTSFAKYKDLKIAYSEVESQITKERCRIMM